MGVIRTGCRVRWATAIFTALALSFDVSRACPADSELAEVRFNIESDRLYLEGSGCITLPDIFAAKNTTPEIPLTAQTLQGAESDVETGYWLFTSDVYIYDGVKLELHGDENCKALRLKSDNKTIELRAHGGWISMLNTEVSAWDEEERTHREDYESPRSYITAISEAIEDPPETCDGHSKNDVGESRMDIINSEVHHLGSYDSESYGLVWKVRGLCVDLSNTDIFDTVNVRGNIRFSDIHHNYFGMYTYGHQDGLWEYNYMHDNAEYGFDPHDDSDNLRIHNNVVYNNGNHGIIASKRCNDVSIQNNVVYDNLNAGIMLHRSSDRAVVRNNTVYGNGDACIAIFESFEGDYSNNWCSYNKYGIRWSVGGSSNKVYDNEIYNTSQYALFFYQGSDPAEASDGKPSFNIVADNLIHNATEGLKMSDTVDNEFTGNVFTSVMDMRFRDSEGIIWKDNTIPAAVDIELTDACFSADSDVDQLGATVC